MEITTIGLDLAKNVFQVHAVDAAGDVATVAMANKMARIVWALMTRGQVYQAHHAPLLSG